MLEVKEKSDYKSFLKSKEFTINNIGFNITHDKINPMLFPFQKDIVKWAIKKGRCAVFLDTGLGKTFIQLEWARIMDKKTLIFAPLSVARQTIREGKKINIEVKYVRDEVDLSEGINITNYEMLEHFSAECVEAIVLDESSILKSLSSVTRKALTDKFKNIEYKMCCTATPAPNDYTEIGNHAHFLNICSMQEMLAMFFINANKEHTTIYGGKSFIRKGSNKNGTEWRIKHHAEDIFFKWLSKWAILMTKPSDIGYEDDGFILPELKMKTVFVNSEYKPDDTLFFTGLHGLGDRTKVRAGAINEKIKVIKELVFGNY